MMFITFTAASLLVTQSTATRKRYVKRRPYEPPSRSVTPSDDVKIDEGSDQKLDQSYDFDMTETRQRASRPAVKPLGFDYGDFDSGDEFSVDSSEKQQALKEIWETEPTKVPEAKFILPTNGFCAQHDASYILRTIPLKLIQFQKSGIPLLYSKNCLATARRREVNREVELLTHLNNECFKRNLNERECEKAEQIMTRMYTATLLSEASLARDFEKPGHGIWKTYPGHLFYEAWKFLETPKEFKKLKIGADAVQLACLLTLNAFFEAKQANKPIKFDRVFKYTLSALIGDENRKYAGLFGNYMHDAFNTYLNGFVMMLDKAIKFKITDFERPQNFVKIMTDHHRRVVESIMKAAATRNCSTGTA